MLLTLLSNPAAGYAYSLTFSDDAGLSDAALTEDVYAREFTDSAGLVDPSAANTYGLVKSVELTTSNGLTDATLAFAKVVTQSADDARGLSDTHTFTQAVVRVFDEARGLSDFTSALFIKPIGANEQAATIGQINSRAGLMRPGVSFGPAPPQSFRLTINDDRQLSDTSSRAAGFARSVSSTAAPSYQSIVQGDGAVGYWPLTSNANAAIGGRNGTLQGTASISAAGLTTTGTGTDYLQLPPDVSTDIRSISTTSMTAEAFVKLVSLGGDAQYGPCIITEQHPSGSDVVLALGVNTNGIYFGLFDGAWHVTASVAPTLGTEEHWAGTYDGATLRLYRNGVLQTGSLARAGSIPTGGGGDWYIGRRWDNTQTINGTIRDVAVYSAALTATQLAAHANYTPGIPDSTGLSDTVTASPIFERLLTDDRGLADTTTVEGAYVRTPTDDTGLVDTRALATERRVTPDDSLGLVDSASTVRAAALTRDDPAGLTDETTRAATLPRTHEDALGSVDTTAREAGFSLTRDDATGLVDTHALVTAYARAFDRSTGIESVVVLAQELLLDRTDDRGLSDLFARAITALRTFDDEAGLSDARVLQPGLVRTDDTGLVDTTARAKHTELVLTDSAGLVDTSSVTSTYARALEDARGLSDEALRVAAYAKTHAEDLGSVDSAQTQIIVERVFTDDLGSVDTTARALALARVYDDQVLVSDAFTQASVYARTLTTDRGLSDETARTSVYARTAEDDRGLTDDAVRAAALVRSFDSVLSQLDGVELATIAARLVNDDRGLTDSVRRATVGALPPDAILAQTNVAGLVGAVQDSPLSPDSFFLTATAPWQVRFSFPGVSSSLLTGPDEQRFRVVIS